MLYLCIYGYLYNFLHSCLNPDQWYQIGVLFLYFSLHIPNEVGIRIQGLNWSNLCKTSLANPDGLPWHMKRKMRGRRSYQNIARRGPRATKECDDGQLFPDLSAATHERHVYFQQLLQKRTPFKVQVNFDIPIFEGQQIQTLQINC